MEITLTEPSCLIGTRIKSESVLWHLAERGAIKQDERTVQSSGAGRKVASLNVAGAVAGRRPEARSDHHIDLVRHQT